MKGCRRTYEGDQVFGAYPTGCVARGGSGSFLAALDPHLPSLSPVVEPQPPSPTTVTSRSPINPEMALSGVRLPRHCSVTGYFQFIASVIRPRVHGYPVFRRKSAGTRGVRNCGVADASSTSNRRPLWPSHSPIHLFAESSMFS